MIIVKGEHIKEDSGKLHVYRIHVDSGEGFANLGFSLFKSFHSGLLRVNLEYLYIFFISKPFKVPFLIFFACFIFPNSL